MQHAAHATAPVASVAAVMLAAFSMPCPLELCEAEQAQRDGVVWASSVDAPRNKVQAIGNSLMIVMASPLQLGSSEPCREATSSSNFSFKRKLPRKARLHGEPEDRRAGQADRHQCAHDPLL
jgi:hypothetical protein